MTALHGDRRQRDEPLGCDPRLSGCESRRPPQKISYTFLVPYFTHNWRTEKPMFRWLSRALCLIGVHKWMRSRTLNIKLCCVVCPKKSDDWLRREDEQKQRREDRDKR